MLKAIPGVEFQFGAGQRSPGLLSSVVKNRAREGSQKQGVNTAALV
jgi:hypothetical protein